MTIQENNHVMRKQLLAQAEKSRSAYIQLSSRPMSAFQSQLAIEHLTRADLFENIAYNLLQI